MESRDPILHVGQDHVSVFALSAFVALKEKGIPFTLHGIDLKAKEQLRPPYSELSLTCKVPTLSHAGFHLSESSAIAEYLEELYPPPVHRALYPQGTRQRARARQLQAWLRSDLQALRSERPADLFYRPRPVAPLSEAAQAAAAKLLWVAGTLLADQALHLFGEWTIADTDLAVTLHRLDADDHPMPASLRRYVQQQWARDSLQQWLALPRP